MIWSLDLYNQNEKNFSIMSRLCQIKTYEPTSPCIYLIEDDKITIKGQQANISVNFVTREIKHCIHQQTMLQDVDKVKSHYWGNYDDKEIAGSFIAEYSILTDAVKHFICFLIIKNDYESLKEFSNGMYSYENENGNEYHFYIQKNPNKNYPERITLEEILIRWIKPTSRNCSIDSLTTNQSSHDGVKLYDFLIDHKILKR